MPNGVNTQGIDQKKLRPLIEKVRKRVKKHPVIKAMFKKYKVPIEELDMIPMCFAEMDVSARTDHGIIYFNTKLLEDNDFDKDDHYLVHEVTHFLQQTTGDKPTQGADEGDYLENPAEVEGFQNQTEYISETRDEESAEEYTNQVLDHHEYDGKKRERKEKQLLRDAWLKYQLKRG